MDFHQWQLQLREELRRRQVPSEYAKRLIDELTHHYLDMQEAALMNPQSEPSPNVLKLMGDPKEIATSAAQLPRRSWAARHPWLSYLLLPPLMSFGVLVLLILANAFLLIPVFRGRTLQSDPWLATACVILGPLHVIVATSIIAVWACRSVAHSGRSKLWGITACVVVAIIAAYTSVLFAPPSGGPGTGRLSLGFGFPLPVLWYQALAPLTIGTIYLALRTNNHSRHVQAESSVVSRAA